LSAFKELKLRTYKAIILPVILYGCENFSQILREEYRMTVFGNRVLRRIFGPTRTEMTGGWMKVLK
jgi:hypothetical protein